VIDFHFNCGRRDRSHSRKHLQCPVDMHSLSEQQQTVDAFTSSHPTLSSEETFTFSIDHIPPSFLSFQSIQIEFVSTRLTPSLSDLVSRSNTATPRAALKLLTHFLLWISSNLNFIATLSRIAQLHHRFCSPTPAIAIGPASLSPLSHQQTHLASLGRPFTHTLASSLPRSQHHTSATLFSGSLKPRPTSIRYLKLVECSTWRERNKLRESLIQRASLRW
jgi:hypothetical protein